MKKVTAAVVIINKNGDILGCHGTGKPQDTGFDFPKGLVEDGERSVEAALRELREETGYILKEEDLFDVGEYPHNKEKNIHIFLHRVYKDEEMPDISQLKCQSFFEFKGKEYPEVDYFEIIPKSDRNKFNKVLQNKFEIIDFFNK
jgi:8-oxo-dGTP pyrophosphatase MutT (NUDIX family)